jgi:hypothetical protein
MGKCAYLCDNMAGRPSKYSIELVTEICERIATTEYGLTVILQENDDYPSVATVLRWLTEENKAEFRDMYARAKEQQAEYMAKKIIDLADDNSNDMVAGESGLSPNSAAVQRSRLQVDTRKWLMAKLAPRKYGDKLDVTTDGEKINTPIIIDWQGKEDNANS